MRIPLPRFLFPPRLADYVESQRVRVLHVMLFATLAGALFFALENIVWDDLPSATAFLLLAGISLIGLYLNHRHQTRLYFLIPALGLVVGWLLVLDYTLYQSEDGLLDPGIVMYPIFILGTTFLFGKRGFVFSLGSSIGSVALLQWLEANGYFTPLYPSTPTRVIGLSVLFVTTALITYIVAETWENHLKQLQESYDLTLEGWGKALEYRDGETEGHSQRVTGLSVALARKLGCSTDEILNIRRGALIHDIGKMGIPDRILLKPGSLDADEWAIMRRHPALAREFIAAIPFLQSAMAIPYSHHERWDGSGYPQGLKGEEIPLAARIFAVVDNWDALCSDRPYRKAWSAEAVTAYLCENRGTLFDPRIVDAFMGIIAENGIEKIT